MLERNFFEGKGAASFVLAAIAEVRGDIVNQYKWTTICSMICSDSIKEDYLHYSGVLSKKMAPFQKSEGQNAVGKTLAKYFAQGEEKDQGYLSAGSAKFARMGDFYALLIGNADYEQLNDLETPIRDIRAVGALLEEKYGAVSYYVENGSRREIMSAFKDLATRVAGNDSVLIFYAGHGKMIEAQNEGYWLPVDAEPSDDFYWISNSYIKSKVREMGAKNILLIADSCFSGLLTRGLEMPVEDSTPSRIKEFQNTPSRVVISSGGLEPVLDGFGGENSIFANEFIKLLKEKNEPLTSGELYTVIRDKVVEKSIEIGAKQVPFMATLVAEGHEGPDFVFVPN